jgi:hypothetical protein
MSILADIQHSLREGDATSRPLIERAQNEDEVQNWIVEQINLRSRNRFHAHREAEVAHGNKPDVIVSSTSAPCEVAVEIKHGGKKWTARLLEHSLTSQLAKDYLKVANRRHGAFIVTNHKSRRWHHPETGAAMTFEDLMQWLAAIAKTQVANESGHIEIQTQGLDTTAPLRREDLRDRTRVTIAASRQPN